MLLRRKLFIRLICLTIAAVSVCGLLIGQANRGGITGTVLDPTGAAVPNATITLTNLGTGQKSNQKASTAGAYNFPSIEPVTYGIEAEAQGFKKKLVENIKIDTATV